MRNKIFLALVFPTLLLFGCKNKNKENSVVDISKEGFVRDLKCRINTAQDTKSIGDEYYKIETENNFVVLNITFTNQGNSEVHLYSEMINYCRGESKYQPRQVGIYDDKWFNFDLEIAAGLTKTRNFAFEIPSNFMSTDYLDIKWDLYHSETLKIYLS